MKTASKIFLSVVTGGAMLLGGALQANAATSTITDTWSNGATATTKTVDGTITTWTDFAPNGDLTEIQASDSTNGTTVYTNFDRSPGAKTSVIEYGAGFNRTKSTSYYSDGKTVRSVNVYDGTSAARCTQSDHCSSGQL